MNGRKAAWKRAITMLIVVFIITGPLYVFATYLVSTYNTVGQVRLETLPSVLTYFVGRFSPEAYLASYRFHFGPSFVSALVLAVMAAWNVYLSFFKTVLTLLVVLAICTWIEATSRFFDILAIVWPIWLIACILVWFVLALCRLTKKTV